MSAFNGSLRYVYDRRRGSDYSTSRPYAASYTQAEVEGNPVDNLTTLRHFFVSDYDKNAIRATANVEPMERVSVSFRADWYKMDYKGPDCGGSNDQVLLPDYTFPSECLGRDEAVGQSYTIDGSWTPVDGWNAFPRRWPD